MPCPSEVPGEQCGSAKSARGVVGDPVGETPVQWVRGPKGGADASESTALEPGVPNEPLVLAA